MEVGEKMDWMMKIIEETFPFKEGEIKGLREAILLDIKVKFGKDKAQLAKHKIQKIHSIRKLKSLKIKITKAKSWQEFIRYLNSYNSSKPSNKKEKS